MAILQDTVQEAVLQLELVRGRSDEVVTLVEASTADLLALDVQVQAQAAALEPKLSALKVALGDGRARVGQSSGKAARALRELAAKVDEGTAKSKTSLESMLTEVSRLTGDLRQAEAALQNIRARLQRDADAVTARLQAGMKMLVEGVVEGRTFLTDDFLPKVGALQASLETRQEQLRKRLSEEVIPEVKRQVEQLHLALADAVNRVRTHASALGQQSRGATEAALGTLDATSKRGIDATETALVGVEQTVDRAVAHIDERLQELVAADKACIDEADTAGPNMVALSEIPGNLQGVLRRARVIR